MTPEQIEERSQQRARRNRNRVLAVFAFTVFSIFVMAWLLQRQQDRLQDMIEVACENRRGNAIKVNAAWDSLARIDAANRSLTPEVRAQRIAAYQAAKLDIPVCP